MIRYDDDEPGSPWSFVVHVDERGSDAQRDALAAILTGEFGGEAACGCRGSEAERADRCAREPDRDHERQLRARAPRRPRGRTLSASRRFETDEVVACGIPGYDQPGTELLADALVVDDDPFAWELSGNCAFASAFDYAS